MLQSLAQRCNADNAEFTDAEALRWTLQAVFDAPSDLAEMQRTACIGLPGAVVKTLECMR